MRAALDQPKRLPIIGQPWDGKQIGVLSSSSPRNDSSGRMNRLSPLMVIAFVLVAASSAMAQQDVEKQVTRMNKKAMEDYDNLEFDSARKTLIDAVSILRANGYDETPLAAKTFINLGVLYINGYKD